MNIKLRQQAKAPDKRQLDALGNWIVAMPTSPPAGLVGQLPYADVIEARRKRRRGKAGDNTVLSLDLPNKAGSHMALALLKKDNSTFQFLSLARKLVAAHKEHPGRELGILVHGFAAASGEQIAETIIAAVLAAAAEMPQFKAKARRKTALQTIRLYGLKTDHAFRRTFAEAEGNALARSLSMLPPNILTPAEYLRRVRQLARDNHWQLEFFDTTVLKKKKAGAFLAVCQGSPTRDAGIVRLQYQPAGKNSRGRKSAQGKLMLVGKGICYDTGGVSLKPPRYMFGMQEDMQGSAVALGTFLALSRLKVNYPVECWLALAMNHIGSKSYLPNDVVVAADGTSIEVVNTDAEGRMVLADTLALASRLKPALIIDYATLTGACMYALGTGYSGVFSNRQELHADLIAAGRDSGERVWPFPLDEDFDKQLESRIADIKQCSQEGAADHILASRFLQRFVSKDCKWVHVDLSSSNNKGGLAHVPTDTTGFGVRYTLNLLLDRKIHG